MDNLRRHTISFAVAVVTAAVLFAALPHPVAADARGGFNDEYVFAATRGVNDMDDVHPAWRVPLFPITILLDVAALPFAVIAGFVG
jgi:hypothetical protein